MTKEEMIEQLENTILLIKQNDKDWLDERDIPILEACIQRMKTVPCEDCISRQAVDELSKELVHTTRDKADFLCNFWEGLQKLPPVTPKPKTGKWIKRHYTKRNGIQFSMDVCNQCGEEFSYDHETGIGTYDYCPNCGAKMVEP